MRCKYLCHPSRCVNLVIHRRPNVRYSCHRRKYEIQKTRSAVTPGPKGGKIFLLMLSSYLLTGKRHYSCSLKLIQNFKSVPQTHPKVKTHAHSCSFPKILTLTHARRRKHPPNRTKIDENGLLTSFSVECSLY